MNSLLVRIPLYVFAFVSLHFCQCGYADEPEYAFFEKRIRPVLVEHCYECHSLAEQEAEGLLDELLKGSKA